MTAAAAVPIFELNEQSKVGCGILVAPLVV